MNLTPENRAKLTLIRTSGLGAVSVRRLLLRYVTAVRAVHESAAWLKPTMVLANEDLLNRELEALEKAQGWMVFYGEANYPTALSELPDAPIMLSGLGKNCLEARQVAIVGNRAASSAGLNFSKQTAYELVQAGIVVTSGLARGVDTAVHEGALQANLQAESALPCTVAVVAGGVNHIYPPENAKLRARIIEHGCVVSEQPFGMVPIANLFPQRNRIIAGLSLGVVVSEATRNSGSLITADFALNYGREVWAVPGSPTEQRSGGPNWLLKNGATLIENTTDILAQLPHSPAPYVQRFRAQPNLFPEEQSRAADDLLSTEAEDTESNTPQPARTRLFALLSATPTVFDNLIRQTGLSEAEANALLIELELEGHAVREADGRWRRG